MTCALRALNLCDGQVLEQPDRGLSECLCAALSHAQRHLSGAMQLAIAVDRAELIERTLQAPSCRA